MDRNESEVVYFCFVVCLLMLAGLIGVYRYTKGRSGPVSGLVFAGFGPFLGVLLIVIDAIRNAARTKDYRFAKQLAATDDDFSLVAYVGIMAVVGLGASLVASILYMYSIRDELDGW